ncbi:MAG: glucose-1-phosphate adenylyltransferase [Acidobacteria bacterium]|nr:MAG: glucose-1-phosphate adenylyltransferase [Acidobacteriota bacterium]
MVRKDRQNPSHVLSIILAGGAGKRLFPLTQDRSKPAVPLGGKYRLIDVPISNCLNSGLKKIFILTQFNSASLNHHITNSYRFDPFAEGFAEVLAAEQTMTNPNWFQGTADAVRQHLHRFTGREDDYQLILSGDQLYRMNYQRVLESHWRHGADVTICVIPKSEAVASSFGLLKLASDGRIEQFREKPKGDALHEMRTDTTPLGLSAEQAAERPYLASMGIYLFKRSVLIDLLADASMIDFGYQVIPRAIEKYDVYGFLFDDYWEDLGTVEAFYKANIDLTSSDPHFDFHDMTAPIYTRTRFLPSSRIERCEIRDSVISEGSVLKGARIVNSIVGIRSLIGEEVVLERVMIMGADYYEDGDDYEYNRQMGIPNIGIGKGSIIRKAIIDKNAHLGTGVRIINEDRVQNFDGAGYYIRDGIVIVPKNGVLLDGTVI